MPSDDKHKHNGKYSHLPLSTSGPIDCAVKGTVLLNTPYFNRGSAHSLEERDEFNLTGLLPQSVQTLEQQVARAYQQYSSRQDDLAKNTFLTSLKEQNLVLYYKVRFNQDFHYFDFGSGFSRSRKPHAEHMTPPIDKPVVVALYGS